MGLFYLILIALGLRVAAAVLLPVMSWDDSYTWWILAIETKNNSFIYTDPWKGHDTIFPPLYPVVSALFMALFSSENIWAPRSISIASGTVVVAMAYLIARRIITPGNTKGPDKRVEPFWTNAPFVGALLLAINPFHIGYTSTVGNEPIFSAWLMFALYFLLKTEKTNHYSYIAAFFVFLASLTRFEIWMLFPFIIWVLIKQQRVATKQFVVSSGIVALGPLIWIWRQQKEFGSWHLFLDFYLSGGSAATASATGDSLLNALFVINISGLFTFGISWYVFYYGFRKLISSKSMKTPGNLSPEINLRDFQVIYGFFSAYVLIMVVISALGLFPAWIKYHVGYFPSVFVIFSIAYYEKLLPALSRLRKNLFFEWKILAVLALIIFCFFKLLPKNINVINYLNGTQQSMIIKAGKVFAGQYEGGMIMIDLPSFIYGTGIPVDKFISSNNIPDDPSHWGKYLEENNIRYLVWTSADYARISRFNEDLVKKNESGVKFEHIYSTDPNPVRKCHVYKVVDYGL